MKKYWLTSALICLPLTALTQNEPAYNARYQVTFETDWSAQTHPVDFPSNPHFSGLIGMTHSSENHIWQPGGIATPGIEQMAETGGKTLLRNEINAMIDANMGVEELLSGFGIGNSPGMTTYEFDISQQSPLVSLVSMIAPSPDWFVGVNGLALRADGQWQQQVVVDLFAYDAGTDAGESYSSPDMGISPWEPIAHIAPNPPFVNNVPLGRFVFELLSTDGNFPLQGKHSGLYFDSQRDGEGLNLTITKSADGLRNTAIITWYTYRNNQQMWLIGSGDFETGAEQISLDVLRTEGTGFGMDFDANDVDVINWGNVTLSIPSCDHLNLEVMATENPDESTSFQYTRLAGIDGLSCDE